MNLKSLRLFRLIVVHGSLASAAEHLHLSQSAASRLLSLLEDYTKLTLFFRTRRKLVLTPEGEHFFQETKHILDGLDAIPNISQDIKRRTREKFMLVTSIPLGSCIVAPAIRTMRKYYPDLDCLVHIEGRFEIENKVATRRYNLGLISLPVTNAIVELQVEPVLQARTEVLLPHDHPLAQQEEITPEELIQYPMVALQAQQLWRKRLDEICSFAGVIPKIVTETTSTVMVQELVREGIGIAIMDRTSAKLFPQDTLVFRPLSVERWVTYGCIFPASGRPPLAQLFVDCLRQYIEQLCSEQEDAAANFKLLRRSIDSSISDS